MVTQEELKSILKYDQDTGNFFWLKNTSNKRAGDKAGSFTSTGYIIISINKKSYKAHRLAFLYMSGVLPTDEVDHIDRNRSNNKWNNLRLATHADNQTNKLNNLKTQSGFTHITYRVINSCWTVRLGKAHKEKFIGNYKDLKEAIKALETSLLDVQDTKALDRFYKQLSIHSKNDT